MSGEALGRDQSCTTRGHTFDKNDIEDIIFATESEN